MTETSENQAIIDLFNNIGAHSIVGGTEADRLALAILPEGRRIESLKPFLDELREAPRRIEGTPQATTIQSLIDYINRFKTGDSAVFADDGQKPSLTAILDFHGQGESAQPRFAVHRMRYDFPLSDQVLAWAAISGKPLGHADMASFLAERQFDIANPPLDWMQVDRKIVDLLIFLLNLGDDAGQIDDEAVDEVFPDQIEGDDRYVPRSALYKLRKIRFGSVQRLIQIARTVEISVNAKAVEGYNPKTGERTVTFSEEHQTHDGQGRRIVVPDAFLLRTPVFEGETPQLIPVRLQYRRGPGGGLSWFMTLVEWRRVLRFAVKAEAERVHAETSLPVFYGKP